MSTLSIIPTPITGAEDLASLASPEVRALALFYQAFNERSLALMQQAWLTTDEISMDNPLGGIRRGWDNIAAGYAKIFAGPAQVYVEFYDYSLHTTADMFFATGRERGYFRVAEQQLELAIRTTRVFARREGQWRQLHHHGSIDDPTQLAAYQAAVTR